MSQNPSQNTILFKPDNINIHYAGRIDFIDPQKPKLSSPGAYFQLNFKGSTCSLLLENEFEGSNYNYISVVCDGKYMERIKVVKGVEKYNIVNGLDDTEHSLLVCKATESFNGYLELKGIICDEILPLKSLPVHRIEFIGDSYTCGALSDTSQGGCGKGNYQDQHNAYLAYGPLLARNLNADWVLSSVSGMGLTRNWNSEGPALPALYNNLFLNADSLSTWSGNDFKPELVTIMLGANDNSSGDGSYDRKPLDSAKFVNECVIFVKRIRTRYPNSIICCINIPTASGELRERFAGYLNTVVKNIEKTTNDNKIYTFSFSNKYESGCNGHPSVEEHEKMASELLPFLKKVTGW
jgi:lysophospholipase L1-like esterase